MKLESNFDLGVGSRSIRPLLKRMYRVLAFLLLCHCAALAQLSSTANPPSAPVATNIDSYIHQAWDTLSRSMTDCHSLIDPKLTEAPVLYLPQEIAEPPEVAALQSRCNVHVERLPRRITHIDDHFPRSRQTPGLLYLPNKYIVPGGRFKEMY